MDLHDTPEQVAYRQEVRAWLADPTRARRGNAAREVLNQAPPLQPINLFEVDLALQ